MNAPHVTHSTGDAIALLRRIERHVPLAASRVVLALVRLPKLQVVKASWIDSPPEIENEIRAGRAGEGRSEWLRALVQDALARLARTETTDQDPRAVAIVRCRRGRVVWLPSDLTWVEALRRETDWYRLPVADCFLVTEHGWRCHQANAAGDAPALAA